MPSASSDSLFWCDPVTGRSVVGCEKVERILNWPWICPLPSKQVCDQECWLLQLFQQNYCYWATQSVTAAVTNMNSKSCVICFTIIILHLFWSCGSTRGVVEPPKHVMELNQWDIEGGDAYLKALLTYHLDYEVSLSQCTWIHHLLLIWTISDVNMLTSPFLWLMFVQEIWCKIYNSLKEDNKMALMCCFCNGSAIDHQPLP